MAERLLLFRFECADGNSGEDTATHTSVKGQGWRHSLEATPGRRRALSPSSELEAKSSQRQRDWFIHLDTSATFEPDSQISLRKVSSASPKSRKGESMVKNTDLASIETSVTK